MLTDVIKSQPYLLLVDVGLRSFTGFEMNAPLVADIETLLGGQE